jgi:hypothetical protein
MKQAEDGFNVGWRRIGTLALWAIPLALGIAASVWLGFAMATHGWFRELSQEQRRAVYVGAGDMPREKLKIETPNAGCLKIEKVDLDGRTATVYVRSHCRGEMRYSLDLQWQLVSPDGTIIGFNKTYGSILGGPNKLDPGQRGEYVFSGWQGIKVDPRAEKIVFTANCYDC